MLRIWLYFYGVFIDTSIDANKYKNQIKQNVNTLRNWVQINATVYTETDLRQFALFLLCYMYGHAIILDFMSSKNYRIRNDISLDIQTIIENKETKDSIVAFIKLNKKKLSYTLVAETTTPQRLQEEKKKKQRANEEEQKKKQRANEEEQKKKQQAKQMKRTCNV